MLSDIFGSLSSFFLSNALILIIIFIVIIFFSLQGYDFSVWERQGVKGPKPLLFFGNSLEPFVNPVISLYNQRFEKYGRVFGYYERNKPVLSIADPELIRYVLVKDSDVFLNRRPNPSRDPLIRNMLISLRDERWKRVRSIMSPTFTSGKIRKMTSMIDSSIKSLLESIDLKVNKNEAINVKQLYGSFTMDVIASCAFATKTNSHNNPNDPFVANAKDFFDFKLWRVLFVIFVPQFIRDAIKFNVISDSVTNFFKLTSKEIIKQRKQSDVKYHDFMQLLLDAQQPSDVSQDIKDINSEQLGSQSQEETESTLKLLNLTKDVKAVLTEEEVLAQCLIFFVAGYETTASLLSYATYALALNPESQELLYKEVKHIFDTEKHFNYENVNKMKYLNAVLNESMRLYTPVIKADREASKDYNFPGTDIVVPKGSLVTIPLFTVHRDERNFQEPLKFKPERFLPENVHEIKPYTFLPFGSGPRNCIGMRFALLEAKLALCNIILRYKFEKCEKTDVPLKMKRFTIILLATENIILRFRKRK